MHSACIKLIHICRVLSNCPAPSRVSLWDEEFVTFSPSGTRKWLREAQLHSSLVRSWPIFLCTYSCFPLDSESSPVQSPYPRPTKGNLWRCRFRASRYHRAFFTSTCSALLPPDLLLYPVRAIMCEYLEMCADHGVVSVLTYVSFFITICYHTPFARPWIYPALAFYGLDLLMRLFRFRIKDASLTPMRDMTIVFVLSFFSPQVLIDIMFVDSHTRLRWRLGSRPTCPASHYL